MKTVTFLLIATAALSTSAEGSRSKRCLSGLADVLTRGHFTGPIVCSSKDRTIRLVGRTSGAGYTVYDYRYRFLPHSQGVYHGGQRVLVFRGQKYAGQYVLSPPSLTNIELNGNHLILRMPNSQEHLTVDLSSIPPKRIHWNGMNAEFVR